MNGIHIDVNFDILLLPGRTKREGGKEGGGGGDIVMSIVDGYCDGGRESGEGEGGWRVWERMGGVGRGRGGVEREAGGR